MPRVFVQRDDPVELLERPTTPVCYQVVPIGDSGLSGGPHLHFMVWRRTLDLTGETLPIRFHDGTAGGVFPRPGVAYAPACSTTGAGCAIDERPPDDAVPTARSARARGGVRRVDGACACNNGAVIHVDLPCSQVCGR